MEQVKQLFQSRKFWVLLSGVAMIAASYSNGSIDAWQAVQALIAAGAAYSIGIAIVDAGSGK